MRISDWSSDVCSSDLAGLVVLSHWLLDLIVHIPDLTLFGAPPKLGLGLWNHPLIEMPLEIALTGGALLYYAARTRAPSGHLRLWVLAGLDRKSTRLNSSH